MWDAKGLEGLNLVRCDKTLPQLCRIIGMIQTSGLCLTPLGNYGTAPDIQFKDTAFVFSVGPPTAAQVARYGEVIMECYKRGIQCAEELSQTADDGGEGTLFYCEGNTPIFKFNKQIFHNVVSFIGYIRVHYLIIVGCGVPFPYRYRKFRYNLYICS